MTREEAINYLTSTGLTEEQVMEVVEALKHQTCGDAVSRAEAIKAMNDLEQEDIEQYGCHIPEGFDGKRAIEALQSLPSVALSAEPCEDAVNRQAVNELQKYRYNCGDTTITCVSLNSINELPSVNSNVNVDALINKIETEFSWSMYDDWGNSTDLHDGLVDIIREWAE